MMLYIQILMDYMTANSNFYFQYFNRLGNVNTNTYPIKWKQRVYIEIEKYKEHQRQKLLLQRYMVSINFVNHLKPRSVEFFKCIFKYILVSWVPLTKIGKYKLKWHRNGFCFGNEYLYGKSYVVDQQYFNLNFVFTFQKMKITLKMSSGMWRRNISFLP